MASINCAFALRSKRAPAAAACPPKLISGTYPEIVVNSLTRLIFELFDVLNSANDAVVASPIVTITLLGKYPRSIEARGPAMLLSATSMITAFALLSSLFLTLDFHSSISRESRFELASAREP